MIGIALGVIEGINNVMWQRVKAENDQLKSQVRQLENQLEYWKQLYYKENANGRTKDSSRNGSGTASNGDMGPLGVLNL